MEYNILKPISSEKDLNHYENYIRSDNLNSKKGKASFNNSSPSTFEEYLKTLIKRTVKIDISVGNNPISRIGILSAVGSNFLIIKIPNKNHNMVFHLNDIKCLTVLG